MTEAYGQRYRENVCIEENTTLNQQLSMRREQSKAYSEMKNLFSVSEMQASRKIHRLSQPITFSDLSQKNKKSQPDDAL